MEVRVNPDGIEIVSYPGPDASIRIEALNGEKIVARRYRNRRIGEFLKELGLTEGRCTGIPTMREAMNQNGSSLPRFSTDEARTYFLVELPAHPQTARAIGAHDEAHDKAHDGACDGGYHGLSETERQILAFLSDGPKGRQEIEQHLGLTGRSGHIFKVLGHLRELELIALTIPDRPRSKNQRMKLTVRGKQWASSDDGEMMGR